MHYLIHDINVAILHKLLYTFSASSLHNAAFSLLQQELQQDVR